VEEVAGCASERPEVQRAESTGANRRPRHGCGRAVRDVDRHASAVRAYTPFSIPWAQSGDCDLAVDAYAGAAFGERDHVDREIVRVRLAVRLQRSEGFRVEGHRSGAASGIAATYAGRPGGQVIAQERLNLADRLGSRPPCMNVNELVGKPGGRLCELAAVAVGLSVDSLRTGRQNHARQQRRGVFSEFWTLSARAYPPVCVGAAPAGRPLGLKQDRSCNERRYQDERHPQSSSSLSSPGLFEETEEPSWTLSENFCLLSH
jgi:hypothetical protein